jgi:hypothetical protein
MKRALLAAVLSTGLNGAVAATDSAALHARVTQADGWVAWTVPMTADAGEPCCYAGDGRGRGECDLDRDRGFGTRDDAKPPRGDLLAVYAHVVHARIDDVRAYAESCPVRSGEAIRRIDGVGAAESIGLLSDWLDGTDGSHRRDDLALAAIAFHGDALATRVLAERTEPSRPHRQREDALFWLGEARGADGAAIVERVATTDGDPKLREHAIFALSQAHAGDPYARIHAIAQSDPDGHVRSQALFWMAQMHDGRAGSDITTALARDPSESVREQAVFALSQLGGDAADAALIALLRGHYPREVKKQALFWLGQSGSPRAMAFFDEALTQSR